MMTSTDLVTTARTLAEHHHDGQVDQAGAPYLGHILRVAEMVSPQEAEYVAAALLHDILEDTDATEADLAAAGIPEVVIAAVVILTKTGGPLDDYYARAGQSHRPGRQARRRGRQQRSVPAVPPRASGTGPADPQVRQSPYGPFGLTAPRTAAELQR